MTTPPRISLSGTNYEIGYNHGSSLRVQIARQIESYYEMFQNSSKLDREGVHRRAREYEATILKLVPHLHQEIVGIAEGAGVDVLDIVALNVRSEIVLGEFQDGCTSISWKVVGEDGKSIQYLAQNWDWVRPVQQNLALVEIEQEGKPTIKMVTEAGIVGKIGYNSHSVGVLLNALRASPTDTSKLPIHVLLRLCLESRTASEALSQIEKYGAASAQHILLGDLSGAQCLELSPIRNHCIYPKDNNFLAHTNHPIENTAIKEPSEFPGSKERLGRTHEIVETIGPKNLSPHRLRETIFNDGKNGNFSICASENACKPKWIRIMTLFNIVICLKEGSEPTAEVVFYNDSAAWIDPKNVLLL
ncbi:uncharacterized protein DFL_001882 [Arthrobotrys flagrans]|uniref:Peptidase C45 hydrolase domain-containing protein n=1 Tax=Arthrobotrys flagrans TaxID=97331 RepID=A0A437A8Y1_ARTFL|nr:hypothetical protein DFL_001882 [Arthrobotrys flagrans]